MFSFFPVLTTLHLKLFTRCLLLQGNTASSSSITPAPSIADGIWKALRICGETSRTCPHAARNWITQLSFGFGGFGVQRACSVFQSVELVHCRVFGVTVKTPSRAVSLCSVHKGQPAHSSGPCQFLVLCQARRLFHKSDPESLTLSDLTVT